MPVEVKKRRHQELANVFREGALKHNQILVGTKQLALLEEVCFIFVLRLSGRKEGNCLLEVYSSTHTAHYFKKIIFNFKIG